MYYLSYEVNALDLPLVEYALFFYNFLKNYFIFGWVGSSLLRAVFL